MANVDAPRGFRLFQNEGKVVRTRTYTKSAAAISEGDLVNRLAAGTVATYVKGATTLPIIGVAAHAAAAADTEIAIIDDPEATYIAQADGTYTEAADGLNADISAAPTPVNGRSGQEVEVATFLATATLPLKVLGIAPAINQNENTPGAVNTDILVKINRSERGNLQTGI